MSYLIVPVAFSCTGSMITPFSMHLDILNTARDIAHEIKTEVSARCKPARDVSVPWILTKNSGRYLDRS